MTVAQQLQTISRRHRWVFREMVLDLKMTEANVLSGGSVTSCFKYLKSVYGSGNAVLVKTEKYLRGCRWVKVPNKTGQAQLDAIVRKYSWVFGEMVVQAKKREAERMFDDVQSMYRCLKTHWKGNKALLQVLRAEVMGGPHKTLGYVTRG